MINLRKYNSHFHKLVRVVLVTSNAIGPRDNVTLYSNIIRDNNISLSNSDHFIPLYEHDSKIVYRSNIIFPFNEAREYKFQINKKLKEKEYIRFYVQVFSCNPLIF